MRCIFLAFRRRFRCCCQVLGPVFLLQHRCCCRQLPGLVVTPPPPLPFKTFPLASCCFLFLRRRLCCHLRDLRIIFLRQHPRHYHQVFMIVIATPQIVSLSPDPQVRFYFYIFHQRLPLCRQVLGILLLRRRPMSIPWDSQCDTNVLLLVASLLGALSLNYFPTLPPSSFPILWDHIPPPTLTSSSSIPQYICHSISIFVAKSIPSSDSSFTLPLPTPLSSVSIPRTHLHPPTYSLSLSTLRNRCHTDTTSIITVGPSVRSQLLFFWKLLQ